MTRDELHALIHDIIAEEVRENPATYNKDAPYQAYERIGFPGIRWSVEKRFAEYQLERFLGPDKVVLDIGSNFGFFVTEFALHCREAHGVEWNPWLNRIGETTANFLGIDDKARFFTIGFEDFKAECAYDTVFSLAAFYTADGKERTAAEEYFGKIHDILAPGGVLFYESTSYTKDEGSQSRSHYLASNHAVEFVSQHMTMLEDYETPSGSPSYFRRFAIARKK